MPVPTRTAFKTVTTPPNPPANSRRAMHRVTIKGRHEAQRTINILYYITDVPTNPAPDKNIVCQDMSLRVVQKISVPLLAMASTNWTWEQLIVEEFEWIAGLAQVTGIHERPTNLQGGRPAPDLPAYVAILTCCRFSAYNGKQRTKKNYWPAVTEPDTDGSFLNGGFMPNVEALITELADQILAQGQDKFIGMYPAVLALDQPPAPNQTDVKSLHVMSSWYGTNLLSTCRRRKWGRGE